MAHVAQEFYQQLLYCTIAWWTLVYIVSKRPIYALCTGSAITRPSWLPVSNLLALHRHRRSIFLLSLAATALAAFVDARPVRVLAAVAFSPYHLAETSCTNRHGEYPILHATLFLAALPSSHWARAALLGVAVDFVLRAGVAKLTAGGAAWAAPDTMRAYLRVYLRSSKPPLCPRLGAFVAASDALCVAIGAGTLLFECLLVPGCLLLPPRLRVCGSAAMIVLHAGIALVMSRNVGLVFLTSLPVHVAGFRCDAPVGTGPWLLAVVLGIGPALCVAARGALREDWPRSDPRLFLWNGAQAGELSRRLMTGDTRLVLTKSGAEVAGARVLHHTERPPEEGERIVHDAVMRVIGFTLARGTLDRVVREMAGAGEAPAVERLVRATRRWLREGRLLDWDGTVLSEAFFVQVGANGRVIRILIDGSKDGE
uniref:HTTM domain-containing protein n=1 Tax=Corethron hystrix TaxID=216773 RepID=A0A7S1BI85_9STRA|mmetsp:Transcript_29227/g.67074  ORF Transcript_29227/g.67074 Transcript_29227/m.67074 type:complete len:426 (+) Transcript_29227:235-1512(+)